MMNCMRNTRVEKHNLKGSENRMNMKIWNLIEINKTSGWQLAPLRTRGWTVLFMMTKSISGWSEQY